MAAFALLGALIPLLFLALIVLVIAALVTGRGDPDTTGRRPYGIFLALVTFIALVATLGGTFTFLKALTDWALVGSSGPVCPPGFPDCAEFGGPMETYGGTGGREVLEALAVAAVSGALLYLSGKKLLELRALEPGSSSPAARVLNVLGYAVAFVLVFAVFAAAVAVVIALIDLADSSGGADQATSTLLSSLAIGAISAWVARYTWRTFDLGLKATAQIPPAPPSSTSP